MRRRVVAGGGWRVAGGAIILALTVPPVAGAQPHHSFDRMVSSNGFGAITYDLATRRLDGLHEHIYKYPTPDVAATQTRDFCWDMYFGLRAGGRSLWMTDVPIAAANTGGGYFHASHVVADVGVVVEQLFFSPFSVPAPAGVMIARLRLEPSFPGGPVSVFSLHNLHLGSGRPEPGTDGERIVWDPVSGSYAETGPSGVAAVYMPIGPITRHGASPDNPYDAVRAGADLVDTDDSGVRDDAVAGFQLDLGDLAPGTMAEFGVAFALDPGGDVAAARARLTALIAGRTPMEVFIAESRLPGPSVEEPAGLTDDERLLWDVSTAILRMGQVREPGPGHGQIVASLPPGQWNISWVRDMCYAIVGLVRSGHLAEARDALRFMLEADVGDYESYVGFPYRISVTRYFGNGVEESDSNEDGPNVEFDGFGLFLWALGELVAADADPWWEAYWPAIREEIADVLVALVDPATGLIRPDSSIWEVHWNGRQKRYAYTSLAAARGLCEASKLAERLGDAATAAEYEAASLALRDAILAELTDADGALAQSWEELRAGSGYRDAAVVEALNWGLVRPDGRTGNATLDSFLLHLVPPSGRGFFRNDDGGWYDRQEWVVIDLRAANAFRLAGRSGVAGDLIDWITGQASLNQNLIAELHEATTSGYEGAIPMVGFGAGAYVIAVAERAAGTAAEPCCGAWPVEPGADADADGDADADADAGADADADGGGDDDAGTDADVGTDAAADVGVGDGGGGCGCRATDAPGGSGWALALLALVLCRAGTAPARGR